MKFIARLVMAALLATFAGCSTAGSVESPLETLANPTTSSDEVWFAYRALHGAAFPSDAETFARIVADERLTLEQRSAAMLLYFDKCIWFPIRMQTLLSDEVFISVAEHLDWIEKLAWSKGLPFADLDLEWGVYGAAIAGDSWADARVAIIVLTPRIEVEDLVKMIQSRSCPEDLMLMVIRVNVY